MKRLIALLLFLSIFAVAAHAAPLPKFIVPDLKRTTGVLPQRLTTADFNNDGNNDVAVANLGPDAFVGGIDVMLGDGAGHLGAPIRTQLGPQNGAYQAAAGDFNGDGKQDLAVLTGITSGYGPIVILLGNGSGGFTLQPTSFDAGRGNIAVADLTGDGKADIVFVPTGTAQIKLFKGKGNGTFAAPIILNRDFDAYDFKLVDVNSDGKLDIVGAAGGPIWSMLNLGGGNFSQQVSDPSQDLSGFRLALADFNGDGKPDVAVVNASGGDVQIGLGVGDGSFTFFHVYTDVSFDTTSIAAGDWTGDGKPDLIVNNTYSGESNIILRMQGVGDGSFGSFTYWVTGNHDPNPVNLNHDGKLDLVALSSDPGQVYATLNSGQGVFKAPQNTKGAGLGSPAKGDVNGDGQLDLVMAGVVLPRPGVLAVRIYTYLNLGNGKFAKAVVSKVRNVESGDNPTEVVLADVNEDGKLDLVAGFAHLNPKVGNIWVLFGDGAGNFNNLTVLDTGDVHSSNNSIAVADVTLDGHLDIIGHANAAVSVLPGTGFGTFGSPIQSGASGSQIKILVADFTLDGIPDVAVIDRTGSEDFGGGQIRLERGLGNGAFAVSQTRTFDGNPNDALFADLNGDSRPDVAVSATGGFDGGRNGLRVALNSASAFGPIAFYAFPPFPIGGIEAGDFDRDGDIDIVGDGPGTLAIALNNGAGTFIGTFDMITSNPSSLLAGDFTGDGKVDLIALNSTNLPLFSLYRNATP